MSNSTFTSRKKELLEKRKGNLTEEYEAIFNQRESTLNAGEKVALKRQLAQLEAKIKKVECELENVSEDNVQEQFKTKDRIKNVNDIKPKKAHKIVIVFSCLLIIGVLNFLPYIQNFILNMQIKKEWQAIQQIEKELNIKLEKLEKIEWTSKGYMLNEKGHITGLGLYDCNIRDLNRISTSLQNLPFLTYLELGKNEINNLIPIRNLMVLTELSLWGNQISNLIPIQNLDSLIWLNLNNNKISNLVPIQNLVSLTTLGLGRNQISNIKPLQNLNSLIYLDLRGNKISDLYGLQKLKQLKTLNLTDNPLEELPDWITDFDIDIRWDTLGDKGYITFYDNPLKNPPPAIVKQGKRAIEKYRKEISFIQQIEKELKITLKVVKSNSNSKGYILNEKGQIIGLNLIDCNIKDLNRISMPIQNLVSLIELRLWDNQISDLKPLQNLNSLTYLYLDNNQIKDISGLEDLKKLKILDLRYNPLKELPVWIIDFDMDIFWTDKYWNIKEGIIFYENPLKNPPVEIVKQGKAAIREYFGRE